MRMADRRCPYCGERVPSNSITCPKCFKKIPNDPEPVRDAGGSGPTAKKDRSRTIMLILAIVPAFIGLLGLGLIYKYPTRKRGYIALLVGLLVFAGAVAGTMSIILIPLAVPLWIMYAILFIGCLFFTMVADFQARVY